ncbi:MAG: KpsF/GutQ family sugar-phosphate isomerase [Holosporales bacterium]|jgi:arabinose-5-phosphate isomerase|nr:KpsF/GutQ family sugar-phosphate isomerase [Holosporales bacterium]
MNHKNVEFKEMDFVEEAKRVILEEANALTELASNFPLNFADAVNLILESNGRLVVSGIGKSGHIGRKIASTMSSLGQKSFFLHPSEAQHGDLGMLDKLDVLLLISYSGEAVELFPVIDFAKRLGIKILAISKGDDTTIAKNADVALYLPDLLEACPLGVAPTVSSTATLALGDALAVALLSRRGFTKEQFKELHPGGSLGRSLSFVYDVMRKKELPLLQTGSNMKDAIVTMSKGKLGCIGVVDQKNVLIGMITDGDLRRHISDHLLSQLVDEVMTKNPITVDKNILTSELLRMMEERKITNMFILNDISQPIGIIHIHDIITRKIV